MKNNLTSKLCRQCRRRKLIEEFPMRKARLCTACTVAFREASVYYHTHKTNPEVIPPGITITADGYNYYRRQLRRAQRAADEEAGRVPVRKRPLYEMLKRKCRRCGIYKDLNEFGSWRIRVCKACDGPTLESLIKHPPRVR